MRGKLGPYTTVDATAVAGDIDTAAVRAWAAEHDIEVAARGKLPAAVIDQYRQATGQ